MFFAEMADHLRYAYLRQMGQAEADEPGQRLREAVLECGDEDDNLLRMKEYVMRICRRIRVSRAAHLYRPSLDDGVEAAVEDSYELLRALDRTENASPLKLAALRRAAAGHWRMRGGENDQETRALAIQLMRVETERSLTLAVAAVEQTREEADEDLWGTAAEEDEKVAAAAELAQRLERESEGAVHHVAADAFRK